MREKLLTADIELLRKIRSRDNRAVGAFAENLQTSLRRYLRGQTPNYEDASNSLATSTITILLEQETEPVLHARLLTYCVAIAKRQWLNQTKKKREVLPEQEYLNHVATVENIYDALEKSERKDLVNRSLRKLPEKCFKLLSLFSYDYKPDEAYTMMGYSSKSVYQVKKSECLERLKCVIMKAPEYRELFETIQEDINHE